MAAVHYFARTYTSTVRSYVGNEEALLFEITSDNAKGELATFLVKVGHDNSNKAELRAFTSIDVDGVRHFVYTAGTKLLPMSATSAGAVRAAWTQAEYGATLQKIGWRVQEWDEEYFKITDLAERVYSGDGSFGEPRYNHRRAHLHV